MSVRPPRLAEFLLLRLLDADACEAVAGDLEEAYRRCRADRGRTAAAWGYWVAATRSIVTCRLTGRRRLAAGPVDYTADRGTLRDALGPALRQFHQQPLYACASVATLALAVGVAVASSAVVRRALVDPLPYAAGDRLVSLLTAVDGDTSAVSARSLRDLQSAGAPLEGYASIRPAMLAFRDRDGTTTVPANLVTPEYWTLLGVVPALGRVTAAGEPRTVVVSWGFWQRALSADDSVLGRSIVLDGQSHTVVGVLPQGYLPPYWPLADVFVPLDLEPLLADPARGRRTLTVLARRADGATASDVSTFLTHFSLQLAERYPVEHGGQMLVAPPLRDELVGAARPALLATAGGALLLLFVVATNLAGLALTRALSARRELAVRAALGATPGRLLRQHAIDAAVLAGTGSAAGVALGAAIVRGLAGVQPLFLDRLTPIALDGATVAAGLGGGLLIGVTAALLPRVVAAAAPDRAALHGARGGSADTVVASGRLALVVAQVALAFVMITGAGLLVRTVWHLATLPLGFDGEQLAMVTVNLPGPRYAQTEAQVRFERAVLDRLAPIPAVRGAAASIGFPVIGGMFASLAIEGRPPSRLDEIAYFSVSPEFVATAGMRVVAGRGLTPMDDARGERVVLVNETMARRFWPDGDAIGARTRIGPGESDSPWITVVGIVADIRQHGPTAEVRPTAFGSTWQYSWPRRTFAVRAGPGASATHLALAIRGAVAAVDPTLAVGPITPVAQLVGERTARHGLVMRALMLFGGVAVLLSITGLYGVVLLSSQGRRREYAIRMALGASGRGVRWMVLGQALRLVGLGIAVGAVAAGGGARAIAGLLHGVQPLDAVTYVGVAAGLVVLALLAAWLPARLAERVTPGEALQAE